MIGKLKSEIHSPGNLLLMVLQIFLHIYPGTVFLRLWAPTPAYKPSADKPTFSLTLMLLHL